jgi:indole-3-acetate monooxygenase
MTTTLQPPTATAGEILGAAVQLAPSVRARATEIEADRRLPADLVEELVSAGCFRLVVPRSLDGAGATPSEAMRVYEALSRADASTGWTVMIGSAGWLDLVRLPSEGLDALFGDGPDLRLAGVFNPVGTAVPVDGGYRVSGRWAFASGCSHSRWFYGNCIEDDGAGEPRFRTVLFRSDEVEIEDTWHVIGLRGTGSHHVAADNVVVPHERTSPTFDGQPSIDDPIVGVPMPSLIALGVASVAIGTAQGALDEITGLADARTPLLARSALAANPLFQHDLATADTQLRAARALVHEIATEAWDAACAGIDLDLEQRARIRAASVWTVDQATSAVHAAHRAGGGSAVYLDSPLQRRLRDIHALTQHFIVRPDTMVTAGAVMVGHDLDVPVF